MNYSETVCLNSHLHRPIHIMSLPGTVGWGILCQNCLAHVSYTGLYSWTDLQTEGEHSAEGESFPKPSLAAQVSYEPFDICLSRANFSHPENQLTSLNRQKLLSQNQVPQSKISVLKNINKFPFHFHFSDVYTPNSSYFDSSCVLYLLQWISCENSIFLSFVESRLPCFIKAIVCNNQRRFGKWLLTLICHLNDKNLLWLLWWEEFKLSLRKVSMFSMSTFWW